MKGLIVCTRLSVNCTAFRPTVQCSKTVCERRPLVDRECISPQCAVRKVCVMFLRSCSCKRCVFYLQIDATDVLSAMGAIPPGFRPSTLSKLLEEGERSCVGSDSNQHENSMFIHAALSAHTSTHCCTTAHQICKLAVTGAHTADVTKITRRVCVCFG